MNEKIPTIFVKPNRDLVVWDPMTKVALPPEGQLKERTDYWLRRVADGDVHVLETDESGDPVAAEPAAAKPDNSKGAEESPAANRSNRKTGNKEQ